MNTELTQVIKDLIKQLEQLGVDLDWPYSKILRYLKADHDTRRSILNEA
jgi:hypothetical protein